MRKLLLVLMVLVMSVMLFAACGEEERTAVAPTPTTAEEPVAEEELYSLDFRLYNYSNAALTDIRISESSEDTFGDNILPDGYVLPDDGSVEITFDTLAPAGTLYDMYTNDEDGDEYHYYDIPLTAVTELSLYVEWYNDGTYNNLYEYK